jgi:hypothetical protein
MEILTRGGEATRVLLKLLAPVFSAMRLCRASERTTQDCQSFSTSGWSSVLNGSARHEESRWQGCRSAFVRPAGGRAVS